jgi:hypothetical protein
VLKGELQMSTTCEITPPKIIIDDTEMHTYQATIYGKDEDILFTGITVTDNFCDAIADALHCITNTTASVVLNRIDR